MSANSNKRITFKRTRPNPLFQEWLEELYEEAKEKKSKLESMLKEALDSLSKYPLPLQSGAECVILKGFEKRLCAHLDQRLEVYNYNLALAQSAETDSLSNSHSTSENTNCNSPMSDIINVENRNLQFMNSHSSTKPNLNNASQINPNTEFEYDAGIPGHVNINLVTSSESLPTNKLKKNKSKGKKYKPAQKSGAYAILIALLDQYKENTNEKSLTKEDLISKAQKYSEESFTRPKPDTYYTAWSSISRLVLKGLVTKVRSKTVTYSLSKEGVELAEELLEDSKKIPTVNDIIFKDALSTSSVSKEDDIHIVNEDTPTPLQSITNTVIELPAGTFDVILLIDKNETGGTSKRNDPTVAQFNKYPDLNHEYRSLKVGDFTWVARHKVNKEQELVLPYIMERKRMDDLGASIKDGRFHEQKFRLRKCGLKNVVYLIENYGSNKHVGLPVQHLMQALANTRVHDDFKVHITDSLTNTARFLAMMTKRLTIRFKDKNLKGCNDEAKEDYLMTFEYFNKASAKTKPLTVTETFIKLLLQLKGVSVEKALAITAKYSTPRSLIVQYQKCDCNEGEYLLANLKYGQLSKNVGPAVSKSIYQLFSSTSLKK